MKYNVMFHHPELPEDEPARWQNFDQLMHDYQAARRAQRRKRTWQYGALLLLGLGVALVAVLYLRPSAPASVLKPISSARPTLTLKPLLVAPPQLPQVALPPAVAAQSRPPAATPAAQKTTTDTGSFIEALPSGGYPALYDYFAAQVQYPEAARKQGQEGTVLLEFMIDTTGQARDIRILQGLDPDLDQEAVRLVEQMPRWSPATVNGQPIATQHTMPLSFTLTRP